MKTLTDECWASFQNRQLTTPCIREALSLSLSLAVIAGATIVKVPQILRVVLKRSVAGISEASVLIEATANFGFCAYHYLEGIPLTNWGEGLCVGVQCLLLVFIYWMIEPGFILRRTATAASGMMFAYIVLAGMFPPAWLPWLAIAPIPISISARVPQLIRNARQGHTGELSLLTILGMNFGHAARVFTTLNDLNEPVILFGHTMALCLQSTLLLQILYYWSSTQKALSKTEKDKSKKKKT